MRIQSKKLGINREVARTRLERLIKESDEIQKRLDDLNKQLIANPTPQLKLLIDETERAMNRLMMALNLTRDWYSVHVWETIENESRILKWLTATLLTLTLVLTIFTVFLVSGIRLP